MSSSEDRPQGLKALVSWCLFDWANSAFPTIVVTFITATYVTKAVAPTPELGTAAWGNAMALSGLAVAVLGPVFGAIADNGGPRKPWLAVLSALTIVSGLALWYVEPEPSFLLLALVLAFLGSACFELGTVFYNAMLPEVAGRRMIGRVSGWAWALGYAGGLAALALVLVVFVLPETPPFGLDKERAEEVRIAAPLVSLWFLVFALPLFLYVPDRPSSGLGTASAISGGLKMLWSSLKQLRHRPVLLRFLAARMLYTDGLNTLFAFGGIYAAGTFGMDFQEILIFAIILNVASGLGALCFSWADDRIGSKPTILIALLALIGLGVPILLIESKLWFYILASGIGLFIGPAQSASRSLMARLAEPEERTEMFGLYALSGRATAFLGPLLVGWLTLVSGSQRVGMATVIVFFLAGFLLLLPLRLPAHAQGAAR